VAQHTLARHFVELVHGNEDAKAAEKQHRASFGHAQAGAEDSVTTFKKLEEKASLPRSEVIGQHLTKVLYTAGFVASRSKAQSLLELNGIKVYSKVTSDDPNEAQPVFRFVRLRAKDKFVVVPEEWLLDGNTLVFMVGKNKVRTLLVTEEGGGTDDAAPTT